MTRPFPDLPSTPDEPSPPRPYRDPDDARQQRLDGAWQFPDDDRDDGYEPAPLRRMCLDRTGARLHEPF